MKSPNELILDSLKSIPLKILVFGPQVENPSADQRISNLQTKRRDIKKALVELGHHAKYAEDLVMVKLDSPDLNSFEEELRIIEEYDIIISLVETPGTLVELGVIANQKEFAEKTHIFMDEDLHGGLAESACLYAETNGAIFSRYEYPADLVECHLLGKVKDTVRQLQLLNLTL